MRRATSVLLATMLSGCAAPRDGAVPATELLIATRDSTFWAVSAGDRARLRGAPLTLAHVDGRFVELYAADDDRSFYDAVFVSQRLFARDLVRGDSVVVAADTIVPTVARDYQARHPDERPLGTDEDASERPRFLATADLLPLDVVGPYLVLEQRVSVDVIGGDDRYRVERGVYDLRSATRVGVEALYGAAEGERLRREGARQAAAWLAAARRAGRADADAYAFDAGGFEFALDGTPGIRFVLRADGPVADLDPVALAPLAVARPAWWDAVAGALPTRDTAGAHWRHGPMRVEARPVDARREQVALVTDRGVPRALGTVTGPVRRVHWLDGSLVDASTRQALARAFDESALYDDRTRVATAARRTGGRGRGAPPPRIAFAQLRR